MIVDLWRQLHEYEPEVQDVLEAMQQQSWALGFDARYRVCDRLNARAGRLIASDPVASCAS